MTWTSDRSGSASSGVRMTATTPPTMTKRVASKTRKRLRPDHSMILASIGIGSSVTSVRIASSLAGRRYGRNDPFPLATLDKLEGNRRTRLQLFEDGVISRLELHGHPRPFQTRNGAVRDARRTGLGVDFFDLTFSLVADGCRRRLFSWRRTTMGVTKTANGSF